LDEQRFTAALFNRVNVRVCSAQGAGGVFHAITFDRFRTAPCYNTGGLLRQLFRRVYNLDFDGDRFLQVLAVFGFFNLPNLFRHNCLLTDVVSLNAKRLPHQ
jgi:hypothetical protein